MSDELFKMNAYGDIWQEPTLFDQGGDVPVTTSSAPTNVNLCATCGDAGTCSVCRAEEEPPPALF